MSGRGKDWGGVFFPQRQHRSLLLLRVRRFRGGVFVPNKPQPPGGFTGVRVRVRGGFVAAPGSVNGRGGVHTIYVWACGGLSC